MSQTAPVAGPTGFLGDNTQAVETAGFWQVAQDAGLSLWNLGTPTPVFVGLLNGPDAPKPGKMAVPGFGMGHDALLFARRGFDVVGFDFAGYSVASASAAAQRQGVKAEFHQADIFALGAEWDGKFDYVLEYTCFCAINPARRADYAALVHRLLRPGGEFIALFFPLKPKEGGPPYSVSEAEIRALFSPGFEIRCWVNQPPLSVPQRAGAEALARMVRK